jgi:hypothetical protein
MVRSLLEVTPRIGLRLALGTHPPMPNLLQPRIRPLHLDEPTYVKARDLVGYVARALIDEHGTAGPYRGRTELAEQAARAVARRAGPSVLIVRLTAYKLRMALESPTHPGGAATTEVLLYFLPTRWGLSILGQPRASAGL